MPDVYETTVGPEGRILIPAELRRQAGLTPGARVHIRAGADGIVVATPAAARRRLRSLFTGLPSLADELIADRRAEAESETSVRPVRRKR